LQFSTPTSKWVQIDVRQYAGSSLDSVLMVYDSTGQTLLGFNDDGGGYPNSRLVFYATAGVNYKIVVGAYGNGSTGNYQVTVDNYYSIVYPIYPIYAYSATLMTTDFQPAFSANPSGMGASNQMVDTYLLQPLQQTSRLPQAALAALQHH